VARWDACGPTCSAVFGSMKPLPHPQPVIPAPVRGSTPDCGIVQRSAIGLGGAVVILAPSTALQTSGFPHTLRLAGMTAEGVAAGAVMLQHFGPSKGAV